MGKKELGKEGKALKKAKPFYKKVWFWVLVIIIAIGGNLGKDEQSGAVDTDEKISSAHKTMVLETEQTSDTSVSTEESSISLTENSESSISETPTTKESVAKTENVPTEYLSALTKGESYAEIMNMSKQGVYDQLTSDYGERFSPEAAQYAIDHLNADWNANALKKAESYSDPMNMSKQGIYDQLTSEAGEQFTPEEAQYAVDNLKANYNENALKKAKSYQEQMAMSPEGIREQLTSAAGEQFTPEEAAYAIQHLND